MTIKTIIRSAVDDALNTYLFEHENRMENLITKIVKDKLDAETIEYAIESNLEEAIEDAIYSALEETVEDLEVD